ncbi:hypothetical protein GCM10010123_41670 [Pilimelia anulata]|uniref:Peptidase S1 domain-containing protein n=1 Tax=Pilimelia anulata TaxID=53371 RepID=A0A8J3BFS4_9ACTN|nr:trypsin-like serine protease [Pilimelia anulata]GGK07414.1 hypothetical protein GCM10010123_41670 [Pilimelia anulata]
MKIRRLGLVAAVIAVQAITSTPALAAPVATTPNADETATPRVINGSPASVKDYPYVIIGTRKGGPRPQGASCTGSVVAPRKVLIAAHCKFADGDKRFLYGLDKYTSDAGGTWIEVTDYKAHPKYDSNNGWQKGYDVAVVTLAADVPVPSGYKFPRVATSKDTALTAIGKTTNFVGYGRIKADENDSAVLLKTDLPVIAESSCKSFLPTYNAKFMFCSGFADGKTGICQGDSGGGTLVDGVVVGVASFVKTGCGSSSGFAKLTGELGDWAVGEIGTAAGTRTSG